MLPVYTTPVHCQAVGSNPKDLDRKLRMPCAPLGIAQTFLTKISLVMALSTATMVSPS